MQKHILLNTLLLIGAICLSTRGVAHASNIDAQPNAPQAQQTADPINQPEKVNQNVAPQIQANGSHEPSTVPTSTNAAPSVVPENSGHSDDNAEDMD